MAPIRPLADDKYVTVERTKAVLDFLLTPQPVVSQAVFRMLGPWLAYLRKEAGWTAAQVAHSIGATSEIVKGMESPDLTTPRGECFAHYWRYAQLLETDLQTLLFSLAEMLAQQPELLAWDRTQFYEADLLQRAERAAAALEAQGDLVTQTAIARQLNTSVASLRHYPRVRAFLAPLADEVLVAHRRDDREAALLEEVQQAIAQLETDGAAISAAAVGRLIGRAPEGFRTYPSVVARIRQATGDPDTRAAQHEASLVEKVEQAIRDLETEGMLVTQAAVAKKVGLTPEALKAYPRIKPLMTAIAGNFAVFQQQRENELLVAVRQAAQQLQAQEQAVEQEAIAKIVGLEVTSLKHHPAVRDLLQSLTREHRERNNALKQTQREQEIVEAIQQAAIDLYTDGKPVTREAILERIGVSGRNISRYLEARVVLKEIVALYGKS